MKCEVGLAECRGKIRRVRGVDINVKLLENRAPLWVTEMRRDRKTASGKISKRERGRTERETVYLSAFLSEAEHTLFSFIMS